MKCFVNIYEAFKFYSHQLQLYNDIRIMFIDGLHSIN